MMFLEAAIFALTLAASGPMVKAPYMGAMAVDAANGATLFEDGGDVKAYPASVTKLMTALLVLDDVAAGRFALADAVTASPPRGKTDLHYRQPSCTGLKTGESMTVDEMLKALMVNSANDAAIFLAEKCCGEVGKFVERMNAKAAELGMRSTRYYNPNGLPPPPFAKERNFNVTTCRDQVRLALAILRTRPELLGYTSMKTWDVTAMGKPFLDGRTQKQIRWVNHNSVMVKDRLKVINPDGTEAVDGLKTGYIDAGGSSIVLTGVRSGRRAVVIVLGSASAAARNESAARIMKDALTAVAW